MASYVGACVPQARARSVPLSKSDVTKDETKETGGSSTESEQKSDEIDSKHIALVIHIDIVTVFPRDRYS